MFGCPLVGEFQGENTHTHTLEAFHKHEATLSYSGLKLMIQIKKNRFSEINLCLCFVCVGDRYIVADCGGGTVDLTVHQIEQPQGTLKELYKASGNLSVHSTKTQKPPHSPAASNALLSLPGGPYGAVRRGPGLRGHPFYQQLQ